MVDEKQATVVADAATIAAEAKDKAVDPPLADAGKAGDKATADAAKGDKGKVSKPVTIADAGTGADERPPASKFPDTWRQDIAGEDKAALKELERYDSPSAWLKSHLSLRKQASDKRAPLVRPGKDAPAEEVATWRAAQGVPESPDKYELKLKDGRALGDDDKPVFDHFAKALHNAGASNEVVSGAVDAYLDLVEKEQAAIIEADENVLAESVRELKEEMSPEDFKRSMVAIRGAEQDRGDVVNEGLFAGAPRELMNLFLGARMENGRKIGGDAAALRLLARLATELNPAATLIPNTGDGPKSITGRLAEIRNIRRTDPDKYHSDKALQAEEMKLKDAELAATKRGKAA